MDEEKNFSEKKIKVKEKLAQDKSLLTGQVDPGRENRLPPGQRLVKNWPVLDLGVQPDISMADWEVSIEGCVANPVKWDFDAFKAEPQTSLVTDIHCVTTWSRYDERFDGVLASHILSVVKPLPDAGFVLLHSYDGYTTNVTLEAFSGEDVLLAHSYGGEALTREHGGPVRMVLPRWYFWKSPKWIKKIEFLEVEKKGFWEERGYHNRADPWKEERYSDGPVEDTFENPDFDWADE